MPLDFETDDRDTQVFTRARRRGQPTFTLVGQDKTAVPTILHWIYLNWETAPEQKLRDAFEDVMRMRDFQRTDYLKVKAAD